MADGPYRAPQDSRNGRRASLIGIMDQKTTSLELKFPDDIINPGTATLDLEIPWLVPDSVRLLHRLVKLDHRVLDIGSGGSTFFYARRAQHVHAVETIKEYFDLVQQRIIGAQLGGKIDYHYHDNNTIVSHVSSLPDNSFDIVSIDTMTGQNRTALFEAALPKWTGRILIMDNWAHKKLWPTLFGLSGDQLLHRYGLDHYQVFDFSHVPYKGQGTRLIISQELMG